MYSAGNPRGGSIDGSSGTAMPRIVANCAAISVTSIAPRTLLPCCTSSRARVARVSATASATRRGEELPVRRTTMPRSASASW